MKIFIIDDDELSIFVIRHLLVLENVTQDITPFFCAEAALKTLKSRKEEDLPDTIFLDLNMPNMDGWDFLEALSPLAEKLSKRCRIYILTSSLEESDTVKIRNYPIVSRIIHKPISKEAIKMVVSENTLAIAPSNKEF